MGYLLTEIVVYLVIAGLIGFALGWAVKAGALDKYFDKVIGLLKKAKEALKAYYLTLTSKKVVKEEVAEVKEEVAPVKVAEVMKAEVKETVETKENVIEVEVEKIVEVTKEEVKAEVAIEEEAKVEVTEVAVAETTKEIESDAPTSEEIVETVVEVSKPTLFKETPAEGKDKLSTLKGIGPVLEKKLNELGVYTYEQIASWDAEQEIWIGTQMAFPKKVSKEEWVKQAKELLKKK